MATFHQQVSVGPKDGSRFQHVIALVDTAATYAVMPGPLLTMLGIAPEWAGVFELAGGGREERGLAEVRLRIDVAERTTICVFGRPDSQPVLGKYALDGFGLAADEAHGTLVPARLFLA
jgi:hypothetical protein